MKISLFVLCFVGLTSCDNEYVRDNNCHLEVMGVNGNVVRLETIVQSSMPLTEMFANTFDPVHVLTTLGINITIDFNNHGNVNRSVGYGIDGQVLFEENQFVPDTNINTSPAVLVNPETNGKISKTQSVYNKDGQVVSVKYFNGNALVWNQKATYNDDGTINTIIKEYESLKLKIGDFSKIYADTTIFRYISYDDMNNWVEAEMIYKGILPKHSSLVKMKRQITYFKEGGKPKLIDQLKYYNNVKLQVCDKMNHIQFGKYGEINIPHYMAVKSDDFVREVLNRMPSNIGVKQNTLFMSGYDDKDAYASFSINQINENGFEDFDSMSPEELEYNEDMNEYIKELNTSMLAKCRIYVIKWLPYQFVKVSGKRALRVRYYRYGIGSPIPVYCESYTIPMKDGNIITVDFSYQSNLEYKFKTDFENSIQSIRFD